jgi:hypothetical protein
VEFCSLGIRDSLKKTGFLYLVNKALSATL